MVVPLVINIEYDIRNRTFNIDGSVKKSAYEPLISGFLSTQIGKGEDNNKPEIRDLYNIKLELYLDNDRFRIKCDTGNKGLRNGILTSILTQLK